MMGKTNVKAWMMAVLVGWLPGAAGADAPTKAVLDGNEAPRALLVLDPVDLAYDVAKRPVGDFVRERAAQGGRFRVLDGDSARKHMREFHLDPDQPCKEFQCAFDAGSALGAEFVMFGTVAPLGELQAYTLNLLHVPTAQVVWARAGEAMRQDEEYPFQAQKRALEWALSDLELSRLDLRKRPGRATVALFGDDGGSVQSKAVHERAVAHLYAARRFDVVNRGELEDLLKAMELQPPAPYAPEESLLALGKKLDVRYVLSSHLVRNNRNYRLRVSMHDLEGKPRKRAFPPKESVDLGKLLRVEDRFFADLGDRSLPPEHFPAAPHSRLKTASKVVSVGAALVAGAGLGYLAYMSKRDADDSYRRFRYSQSQEEAENLRAKVRSKDEDATRYGIMGGVSLMLGTSIWAF